MPAGVAAVAEAERDAAPAGAWRANGQRSGSSSAEPSSPEVAATHGAGGADLHRLKARMCDARSTLAEALQTLSTEHALLPAPRLQPRAGASSSEPNRVEAELRCSLASLRHADREIRALRQSLAEASGLASPRPQPAAHAADGFDGAMQRWREPSRDELEAQLIESKLLVAELQTRLDEQAHFTRGLQGTIRYLVTRDRERDRPDRPDGAAPADFVNSHVTAL